MSDNRPIGVFDSGIGGLTVVKELINALPKENIVYFGDTGRVPYGNKSTETIKRYATEDERFLLSYNVKAIIAACGTVSSVSYNEPPVLPVPFFEVVSHSVKAAVNSTKNKKIGVIATPATILSSTHKNLILKAMPSATVTAVPCPLFVPIVEEGLFSKEDKIVMATIERYLSVFKENGTDTLIMGCTHYPVLENAIKSYLGDDVTLINMGKATTDTVKAYLQNNNMLNTDNNLPYHNFFVSDKTASFCKIASLLLGEEINDNNIKKVDLEKI